MKPIKITNNQYINIISCIFVLGVIIISTILMLNKYYYHDADYDVLKINSNYNENDKDYIAIGNDLSKLTADTEKFTLKNEIVSIMDNYIKDILSDQGLNNQLVSSFNRLNYIDSESPYPFLEKLHEIDSIQSLAITNLIDSEISSIQENLDTLTIEFATERIDVETYEEKSCLEIAKIEVLKKYKINIFTRYNIDDNQLISEYLSNISNYLNIKLDLSQDLSNNLISKDEYNFKIKTLDSKIKYYNDLITEITSNQ